MARWAWIVGGVAAAVLLGTGGYVTYTHYRERGIRNNNPGNLRINDKLPWKGKVPLAQNTDGAFEQFKDFGGQPGHVWGIRAMYLDLRGDVLKDGLNTVRKLISSYAPESDNNDTAAYIAAVSSAIGKKPDATLTAADLVPLMQAITKHENGVNPYPVTDFQKAVALA